MGTRVGVSGTRQGPSEHQLKALRFYLYMMLNMTELHHGDCVGVDSVADDIAIKLKVPRVIHPPDQPLYRAFCNRKEQGEVKEVKPVLPYLERNKDLVDSIDVLIACPLSDETKGGTWHAISLAKKRGIPTIVLHREDINVGGR